MAPATYSEERIVERPAIALFAELVEDRRGGTWRVVYTVRFEKAVYVLHAFQKKSPSGIRTAERDVDLVAERLKTAAKDYGDHYGKAKH